MTQREITTKGFQDKVREIAKDFIAFVNSNKEYHNTNTELMLLLNKLNSNIQGATLLASYGMFNESKIVLRSGFETLVLFEYLSTFPEEMKKYIEDNAILEYQNLFGFYKRGYGSFEDLIKAYNKLSDFIDKKIPFEEKTESGVVSYNQDVLEKYFRGSRDGFKPLSQQVRKMIDNLNKAQSFKSKKLKEYQIILYNINSQVAHSRLETLYLPIEDLSENKIKTEVQDCFSHSAWMLKFVVDYLVEKQDYEYPQDLHEKIVNTMRYLDFDIPELKQY